MIIDNGKFISLTYQLKLNNAEGETVETVTEDQPMSFLFGQNMLLPKFEENIKGKKQGDSFEFILKAEDAYGEYRQEAVVDIPISAFDLDNPENKKLVQAGKSLKMRDQEGHIIEGVVLEVKSNVVIMDFNHKMAGQQLHFNGTVIEVRDTTEQDLMMFSHGCGGCSGSCSGGCH